MTPRVLLVDDDPNVLMGYKRNLRLEFTIVTATSGKEALFLLTRAEPFAVVVADFNMPGMNGIEFLAQVKVLP